MQSAEVHSIKLDEAQAGRESRFNPYIYEERVHRWWWKDGEKQYEVFWGNELFVGQVVEPMIKHYCESANQQLAAQAPSLQLQLNITNEIQSITGNFFSALATKREKTQDDIARS